MADREASAVHVPRWAAIAAALAAVRPEGLAAADAALAAVRAADSAEAGAAFKWNRHRRREQSGCLPIFSPAFCALRWGCDSDIIFFEKTLFSADEIEGFIRLFDKRQEVKTVG